MAFSLSEASISTALHKHYQPGKVDLGDGHAERSPDKPKKCAAVLIPLVWHQDKWQVVFTRRTDSVEHHKGQISFPGGGCEEGETSPETTALREAREEVGIDPSDVRLLGRLNDVVTITAYLVTPVVGVIPWPYPLKLAPQEVARVFSMPLAWLAERSNWQEQSFTPPGQERTFQVVRYRPYDGEVLWGITARITLNFLTALGI